MVFLNLYYHERQYFGYDQEDDDYYHSEQYYAAESGVSTIKVYVENEDKRSETIRIHREVNVFSLKVKKVSLQWFRSVH